VKSGRLRLHLEDDGGTVRQVELGAGDYRHVPTGRIHRFEAIDRCELIEVSTPELDDVVRIQDDFGREGTSAP
jgi:mannose-6-phosphate isomerase